VADYPGAVEAIEARLSAGWSTTPIAFDNDDTPDILDAEGRPKPWVFCEVLTTDAVLAEVGVPGANATRDEGLVRCVVFVPAGTGRALARQYAAQIGEIFRTAEFYTADAGACVRTWVPRISPGNTATSRNPDGNWWAVTMTVAWDFIRRT
jgi:hypothetical protein